MMHTTGLSVQGRLSHTDEMQSVPLIFRVGGVGIVPFVAPVTGNYTFHLKASDGGELWLSPDADPRSARRILSSRSEHRDALKLPESKNKASTINNEWSCLGYGDDRVCFRYFQFLKTTSTLKPFAWAMEHVSQHRRRARSTMSFKISRNSVSVWLGLSDLVLKGIGTIVTVHMQRLLMIAKATAIGHSKSGLSPT